MKRLISLFMLLALVVGSAFAQSAAPADDNAEMRNELEQLKKTVASLEERLAASEKKAAAPAPHAQEAHANADITSFKDALKDLDHRVMRTERKSAIDRLNWTGEFRSESSSIFATVPTHYDGMVLQNLLVRTMWMYSPTSQGGLNNPGACDPSLPGYDSCLQGLVTQNYSAYSAFTNNLKYRDIQSFLGAFTPAQIQGLMGAMLPYTYTPGYSADANAIMTNRLRLGMNAQVSNNISVTARLTMYKVFGDSTGVQVFNGQPTSISIDGTTSRVPTGDMLRVERAYFVWKDVGGSKFYFSVGRRPSTEGPPLAYRQDDPRGGTPSGALINYQFDGATLGYHLTDKITPRLCYGLGYDSGWGNGQLLSPANRVRSVHFLGANVDLYNTDNTLVQVIAAKAWNVTDGFNGFIVLPNNPLTGDAINAPVIMRYTPSTNLGNIFLYGIDAQHEFNKFTLYGSLNWDSLRPNGQSTPFGGMGSDPFQPTHDHDGWMVYVGGRYKFNHNRTKLGFEYNHGSKYWFNFAQAEDDILQPKTSARGNVYEAYLTHRINRRFIFKVDYQRFNYQWSGSGWHLGEPKSLTGAPQVLGFPTYNTANLLSFGLNAKF
jgi:hypothetical protein